jgi:lipopolysaccharide export system ATP-binding protein
VSGLVLKRDIYYTLKPGKADYGELWPLLPGRAFDAAGQIAEVFDLLADPARFSLITDLRSHDFRIGPSRYMMMGDNSPKSKDGRGWEREDQMDPSYPKSGWDPAPREYWEVPERLLTGKAFYVYWPHGKPFGPRHPGQPRLPHPLPSLPRADEVDPLNWGASAGWSPPTSRRPPAIMEDRPMALLDVRGLEKWYGRRQVVNGVDFEVEQGEVVGLLGPNGAGKTTSFRMTIGLISADGGQVLFDGRDITRLPMYQRARAGMGYLPQESSVFKQLSVEDNLMAILETRPGLNRRRRKERQADLLEQFGLEKIRRTKAQFISGGEKRRLEIARSLIAEPKLVMLDEPFAGIDPKTVSEIQDAIRALADEHGIGILLTDHQFRETLEVTDRCYLIREGRVFAHGDRRQILNNPDVRRYYIGERFDVGHLLDRPRPPCPATDVAALGTTEVIIDEVDDEPGPGEDAPMVPMG